MTSRIRKIPVTFAGIDRPGKVPVWAQREYKAKSTTIARLTRDKELKGVSVVRAGNLEQFLHDKAAYDPLFVKLVADRGRHFRMVLGFEDTDGADPGEIANALQNISESIVGIELSFQAQNLRSSLMEAVTKLLATQLGEDAAATSDSLGEIKQIADAGKSLRSEWGHLDAKKVAVAFGITDAELARQIGVKKQTLGKTPASNHLQPLLRPYERVARLRLILDDEAFRAWLNTPNKHLENGDAPMDYLQQGAHEPLADFAENMLLGAPT